MLTDVRYACRSFLKTPGFTFIIVLTIALGIGANTAIFTLVNAVLLRPFPYDNAASIARVRRGTSYPDMLDWVQSTRSFSTIGGFRPQLFDYTDGSDAERIDGALVTGDAMSLFSARALSGRLITPADDAVGRERIVVVSDVFWRNYLGSDPAVVGRRLSLSGRTYTIVGVVENRFELPGTRAHVFAPFVPEAEREVTSRGAHTLRAFVRILPGVSLDQAQHELDALASTLEGRYPETNGDVVFRLQPLADSVVGTARQPLLILGGTVAFVLLIACVNVANLLLARGAARRSELAVRAAIGATPARILRQLLAESLLIALVGGILGLAVGYVMSAAIVALAPETVPRLASVTLDRTVLGFTALASLAAAVVFGVLPAWVGAKTSLADAARSETRVTGGGNRSRAALMIAETALAAVLLVGAGLLLRSFVALTRQPLGFSPQNIVTANLTLSGERYGDIETRTRLFHELEDRVLSIAGVRSVALTTDLPIGGAPLFHNLAFEGRAMTPGTEPEVYYRAISTGYFDTLGIPLKRGRVFTTGDREGAPRVAIVNEAFARDYYAGQDPLGRRIKWASGDGTWMTIVGVAADVRALSLDQGEVPAVHVPFAQEQSPWRRWMDIAVKADGSIHAVMPAIRAELRALDRNVPLARVRSMDDVLATSLADRRFNLMLLGGFALLALLLAAAGTYGVMSYLVLQRTREIGVRMALGARPSDVLRLIASRGLMLAGAGVFLGLAIASAAARVVESMLFQVAARDGVTYGAAATVLLMSAAAAMWIPARRATRVDPLTALRSE